MLCSGLQSFPSRTATASSSITSRGKPLLNLTATHLPLCYRAEGDICSGSWGSTVEMVWQHQEESPEEEAGSLCCSSLHCLCRGAVVECPDEPEAVNELLTPRMPKRQTNLMSFPRFVAAFLKSFRWAHLWGARGT